MFDYVNAGGTCPKCGKLRIFECQTKDLDPGGGQVYHFRSLPEHWLEPDTLFGRAFRRATSVFPEFPYDKSPSVWNDQAERIEAAATIPEELWDKLNFIEVVFVCSCGAAFRGKLAVKGKFLWGPLYDVREDK